MAKEVSMIEREERDGVVTMRLAHGKASALDVELTEAIRRELDAAADARAVVLTGTGSIFSAGVDLFRILDGGAAYAERFCDVEESAVTLAMRAHGVDMTAFPPVVMSMIVTSLARIVLLERGLGITRGHAEAEAFIEHYLERFELPPM